jgi:hypothetical protein
MGAAQDRNFKGSRCLEDRLGIYGYLIKLHDVTTRQL